MVKVVAVNRGNPYFPEIFAQTADRFFALYVQLIYTYVTHVVVFHIQRRFNLCPVNGGEFTPPRRYFIRNEADPCPIFKRFFVTLLVGP